MLILNLQSEMLFLSDVSGIRFIADTPRIDGTNVTINFQVEGSQCLQVLCDLSPDVDPRDCKYTNLVAT